jgi:hypothetical protein
LFNSKLVGLFAAMGLVIGGCAVEPGQEEAPDGEEDLGTVSSPIWTDTSPGNLQYRVELRNRQTGYCLEVDGGVAAAGTAILQRACTRGSSQRFTILQGGSWYQIVWRPASHLCVGVAGARALDNTPLVLVPCRDAQNAQTLNSVFTLSRGENLQDPVTSRMTFKFAAAGASTSAGACIDNFDARPAYQPLTITPPPSPWEPVIGPTAPKPNPFPVPPGAGMRANTCDGSPNQHFQVTNY